MNDRGEFQRILRQKLLQEDSLRKSKVKVVDQPTKIRDDEKDKIDAYIDSLFHSRAKDSVQEEFDFSDVMYDVVDLLGRSFARYYTGNEMDRVTKGRKLAIRILYYPGSAIFEEEEIIIQSCSETVEQVKQILRDCIMNKQKGREKE